jgi:hypothetical protein
VYGKITNKFSIRGIEPTRHYVIGEDFSTAFRAWRDDLSRLTRPNRAEPESYHSHRLAAGPSVRARTSSQPNRWALLRRTIDALSRPLVRFAEALELTV